MRLSPAVKVFSFCCFFLLVSASNGYALEKIVADSATVSAETKLPLRMEELQNISASHAGKKLTDDDIPGELNISLDLRKDAQKEAALSYGARGGLARRNFYLMERLQSYEPTLDHVFDFRRLLIRASSGLMIEPPIIRESDDALVITQGGVEAAVADKIYNISKQAKIVTAPRDWRHYLVQDWGDVPPPPKILWPKTAQEQADWDTWIEQGWNEGYDQAERMFDANLNRLVADFSGMVRYRLLVAQGMVSKPFAMHEDRGVTGTPQKEMRVGDRAIRITGPSQFQIGAETWKPADR